jgi:hypothetical protein
LDLSVADSPGSDRARWVRDAVEAALSDILLLGTGDLPPGFRGNRYHVDAFTESDVPGRKMKSEDSRANKNGGRSK